MSVIALDNAINIYQIVRRSPGFAAVAVITLALGIGLNVASFTLVNSIVLRALPYSDADRLAAVVNRSLARAAWPGGDPLGRTRPARCAACCTRSSPSTCRHSSSPSPSSARRR
jgi:hypothetical protein